MTKRNATPPIDFGQQLDCLSRFLKYQIEKSLNIDRPKAQPRVKIEKAVIQALGVQNCNDQEYLLVLMALAPHIRPGFFDEAIQKALPKAGDFPQLGGTRGKQFRGFLPTGETALFLLAGEDLEPRFTVQELFNEDHFFAKNQILWLEDAPSGEPKMSGKLVMAQDFVDRLTTGKISLPKFGLSFPAQRIETQLNWEDLVLNTKTKKLIRDLQYWIEYGEVLQKDWGLAERIKPGYRVLFHGPPGTGKTMAATLLGKYTGKEVYRIDLSMVVSKFIGETEKNLANLFAKAENKDWILFFDEADAIFGKRTNVRDAHDKYANQEVSYLLQRVENYQGMVVLASNFKNNIDEAFLRRFQSIIYFPPPQKTERLKLWNGILPEQLPLSEKVDIESIAERFELTGANIVNVVQQIGLHHLASRSTEVTLHQVEEAISKEFGKEGKML